MRIGIISYDYRPSIGGLGIMVSADIDALRKAHPSDTIIVLSPSRKAEKLVSAVARWWWKKRGGCPIFSVTLLWSLNSLIQKHALDIVHVHTGSGGVCILRKPRCPLIVTSHHTYKQEARMVFASSPIKRVVKLCMSLLEKRTYILAKSIACVSADTKDELIHAYGIDPAKIIIIENAVDVQKYAVMSHEKRHEQTIVYIGRLEPRKGIWVLLAAFVELRKTHPQALLRLVGTNLLGAALDTYVEDHDDLNTSVQCLGHLHETLVDHELSTATVLVVPSKVEGFGLIAAQGMAAGCCVIASDCPGLRSVITHQKTGLLFTSGDAQSCVAALRLALDTPKLRDRLSEQARTEAQKRFTLSTHVDTLYSWYVDCLSRQK